MKGDFVACSNVNESTAALNISYDQSEWRLLIDSSTTSLMAILLRNGNTLPLVPVGHAGDIQHNAASKVHKLRPTSAADV